MPSQDALMCRKYAQEFLRSLDLKSPEDFAAHTLEWAALGKAKRAGNRAISDLIDRLNDGVDQKCAAEIEAASDAVATIVRTADLEMDDRTEIGDRSARADPIAAMRPQFENLISPAVDGNPLGQIEVDPYSLRSDQSMRAWAQPRQDNRFASLSTGRYFKTLLCGASNDTEARALSEGTDSQGGFTTPAPVALNLIDQLRANSVVNQAGENNDSVNLRQPNNRKAGF